LCQACYIEFVPFFLQEQCVHFGWLHIVQYHFRELNHTCQGCPYDSILPFLETNSFLASSSYFRNVLFVLSHIVVKGSRSSKFVVCTGSVRAQHAEQLISGLKYKQAGSVLRRWRSPVRIRLAAPRVFRVSELHEV
jgi:hypothetical protein